MSTMRYCPNCQRNTALHRASPPVVTAYVLPLLLAVVGLVLLPLAVILWPLALLLMLWGHLGLKQACSQCGLPKKRTQRAKPMPG